VADDRLKFEESARGARDSMDELGWSIISSPSRHCPPSHDELPTVGDCSNTINLIVLRLGIHRGTIQTLSVRPPNFGVGSSPPYSISERGCSKSQTNVLFAAKPTRISGQFSLCGRMGRPIFDYRPCSNPPEWKRGAEVSRRTKTPAPHVSFGGVATKPVGQYSGVVAERARASREMRRNPRVGGTALRP
jgi:hypothetical protein